jgi:hypothetical protein
LPIKILAEKLSINTKNIYANEIYFDKKGNYKGYDQKSILAKNKGKNLILRKIKKIKGKMIFIGDGATDYEAKNEADLFVGFGGVVERKKIKKLSPIYIRCCDLTPLLILIAGKIGCDKLLKTPFKQTIQKGLTYMFGRKGIVFNEQYQTLKKEIKNYFLEEGV